MRRLSKEQIDKLDQALAQAYELQDAPHFSIPWIDSVMRDVRRQSSRQGTPTEVPRLVWRAAAVVALVSALFVGSVLIWNAGRADADFPALFAEASVDAILLTGEP